MHTNTLLRYQNILELYEQHKNEDVPLTVVWRKYIYPRYPISRQTLYNILGTPVKKQLKEKAEQGQLTLKL